MTLPAQLIKNPILHQMLEEFYQVALYRDQFPQLDKQEFFLLFCDAFAKKHGLSDRQLETCQIMVCALWGWSLEKVVFHFNAHLYREFKEKPALLDFLPPQELLSKTPFKQPYYCFQGEAYDGFTFGFEQQSIAINFIGFVHHEYVVHQINLSLVGVDCLENQIDQFEQKEFECVSREALKGLIGLALQMILYTCSEEPDIEERVIHKPLKEKNSAYRPRFVRQLTVGNTIGAQLNLEYVAWREAQDDVSVETGTRPHLRRAHWHLVWKGSIKHGRGAGHQTPELRWFPPCLVNIDQGTVIEKTVH